jgi:hypothetical protein
VLINQVNNTRLSGFIYRLFNEWQFEIVTKPLNNSSVRSEEAGMEREMLLFERQKQRLCAKLAVIQTEPK